MLPIQIEIPAIRMLLKLMDECSDGLEERLIFLERASLDRDVALQHYMQVREESIKRANEKVSDKGIEEGDLVLRYNSRLDKTMQKKFQIKWEGPFKVVQKFAHNGTFQLADLDGQIWMDCYMHTGLMDPV